MGLENSESCTVPQATPTAPLFRSAVERANAISSDRKMEDRKKIFIIPFRALFSRSSGMSG